MPKNNKVAAAPSLLKILARIDRLEQEVRTQQEASHVRTTSNDLQRIQNIMVHGIEMIHAQYEQMGETIGDLQAFARELEQYVESDDEELSSLTLLKFERIFDCEQ